jgi:hypothetical protein
MTASMPWVKLYTETLDDVKLARLADSQKWRFIQLILLAGECDADGALVTGDSPMTHEDITWRLRIDTKTLVSDLEKLMQLKLIHEEDGVIVVSKFGERQGPTQSEKREQWRKRQKARRERLKGLNVTGDSPETHPPRGEEEEDKEGEGDAPPADPFDQVQTWMEQTTGRSPSGDGGIKAINDILAMGATLPDIQAAYDWHKANKGVVSYYSSMIGPIRTAINQRLKAANGHGMTELEKAQRALYPEQFERQ